MNCMEERETRKLQVTGGSTYILSLPKKWVIQMGLDKGSQVTLVRQGDESILVVPEEYTKPEKLNEGIILSAKESDLTIRRVISAYLVGYNVIYVRSKDGRIDFNQRNDIKNIIRKKLVGTEIIADSPEEIIIRVLLGYPDLSVESALRRMCIIASSMHKDAMISLQKLDKNLAKETVAMDDEVDRFSLYIIRQLKAAVEDEKIIKEIGLSSRRDCIGFRLITKSVERTADHAVRIAENILKLKKPVEKKLYTLIEDMCLSAISLFNLSVETLFREDFQHANETVMNAKKVASMRTNLMEHIFKKTDIEEVSSLGLIIDSIIRTAEYSSDIAEIVLNLNIDKIILSSLD